MNSPERYGFRTAKGYDGGSMGVYVGAAMTTLTNVGRNNASNNDPIVG
jgi:hypothetical protein